MKLLLFLCLLTLAFPCYSQVICNSGDNIEIIIPINMDSPLDIQRVSFYICFSNLTVFYVDSLKLTNTQGLQSVCMDIKINYNCLKCDIVLSDNSVFNSCNTLNIVLYGTGMFGNDTITNMYISNKMINNENINSLSDSIIIISKSVPLHQYARYTRVTAIYPTPLTSSEPINIDYVIDSPEPVEITIYNDIGILLYNNIISDHTIGKNTFSFIPAEYFDSGIYILQITSDSGKDIQKFIIRN